MVESEGVMEVGGGKEEWRGEAGRESGGERQEKGVKGRGREGEWKGEAGRGSGGQRQGGGVMQGRRRDGEQSGKREQWGREQCEGMEGGGARAHSPELVVTHVHSHVLAIIHG